MRNKFKKSVGLLSLGLLLSLMIAGAVMATSYTYTTVTDCDLLDSDGTWGSGGAGGAPDVDMADKKEGTSSIKRVTTNTISFYPAFPEDLSDTGQVVTFWLKSTVASADMTDLGFWISDGDGDMNYYEISFLADTWTEITVDLSLPDASDSPDLSSITEFQVSWDIQLEEDYTTFHIDDIRKGVTAAPAAPDSTTKTLAEILPIVLICILVFSGAILLSKNLSINNLIIYVVTIIIALSCLPIMTDLISGL